MSISEISRRGALWFEALTANTPVLDGYPASLRVADAPLAGQPARYLAVVQDEASPFVRARSGEVGLIEGWSLARAVNEIVVVDRNASVKRALVAVIDVPSQAYGRREEAYGIHQALAAAAGAYARARQEGHPVIGLIVGKAMSGAFLAHGYQANRLIALHDEAVMVHAMGKQSAARVTMRTVDDLEAFAARIPPMAYDIDSYASLGLLWKLLKVGSPDMPSAADLDAVQSALAAALTDIESDSSRDLSCRLAAQPREASRRVRALLREQWKS